jgi:hypothetical protein
MLTSVRRALTALSPALALLSLLLLSGGCRQADGPMPTPNREQANEIGDIARDLINVANKDPQAPDELRGDIAKYGSNDAAVQQMSDLAREVSQALAGARLDDQSAQNLATTLWVGLTARELSERQVETLGRDVKAALASTGVPEDRAQSIADRLNAVQKTITANPRRWYQVF